MSTPSSSGPAAIDEPTRHLGASIPVVCAHLKQDVSVSRARDEIRHAALRLSADMAGASVKSLAAKLEHATGCTIAQLAAHAERWPASAQVARPGDRKVIGMEFFCWWFVDERTGERCLTTYKLSRANAERAYPGAEPDLQTREWRSVPLVGHEPPTSRPGGHWS